LARRDHALDVRVPASARVPLGDDQHVLAERGQVEAAQWASVRGGLAILSPPDVVPIGAVQVDHTSKDRIRRSQHGIVAAVEHRDERIVVETDRYRITGLLRLPRGGYRSRLTDYLNASERGFVPLTDVELEPLDGSGAPERCPFLALSVNHIVIAMPAIAEQPVE
jgi:hypothetical protein